MQGGQSLFSVSFSVFFMKGFCGNYAENLIINLKIFYMTGEKSSEKKFFSILYEIASEKMISPLPSLFILAGYLLELLLCYFVLVDSSNIISTTLANSTPFALTLLASMGAVVMELVVVFLYDVQVQLLLQLMLFRYILFPMALLLLVEEIQVSHLLSTEVAALLLVLIAIISYFINFIIHSYLDCSIKRAFQQASSCMVLTDCFFVLSKIPSSFIYIEAITVTMLILHLLARHKLDRQALTSTRQQLQYFSMFLKDFLIVIYLSRKAFITGGNAFLFLALISPLILLAVVREVTRRRRVILNSLIFTAEAPVEDFLETIGALGVQLMRFKSNQDLELHGSLLLVFVALHRGRCSNSSCLLQQRSTEEEIRNCNSSNNMKILKHKIVKKMEFLFDLYEVVYCDHPQLKLSLLAFYATHLPNKLKISHLISSIRALPLSWDERLVLFGLEKRVEQIEIVEELLAVSKSQDEYVEFKKLMSSAVGYFQEFWSQLLEESIDINQLASISSRLFPLKKNIEQAWRRHLNRQKFSSWNILRTYTYYRRNILHDYTNSVILEDFTKIIEQRLKAKHEMSYINSETEQPVMAISLTESSLGNIASMNNQTCKLFNFPSKSEMMELRVNDIMPSVYSVVHDNILSSFLKNRFKSINQDLRFVFGKNKNGFIFPFLLQLRKLSWNLNDQLIFIAHLEPAKLRSAPIFCIADLEGDLQDYTSTFAWLFMKKGKENREIKRKNIQQMIPSFFEAVDSAESMSKVCFHQRTYSHKNGTNIEIQFSATELFIKREKVGYLVEGINSQSLQSIREQKSISSILSHFYQQNNIYTNSYDPKTLAFQIPNQKELTGKRMTKEFTIPFLKTSDIEGIFRFKQDKPVYGEKIKTLRLINGRLEHVIEEESFRSDEQNFEMKEISVIKKIEKMKQELGTEQKTSIGSYFKHAVTVLIVLCLLFASLILASVSSFDSSQLQKTEDITQKLRIRQLLPEYLIYTLYEPLGLHASVKDQLKDNIISSKINEQQKENIMRIIFSAPIEENFYLDPTLLNFTYYQNRPSYSIMPLWYLSAVSAFLYLIGLIVIYLLFKAKILNIYLIFLSIKDNKLQQMQEQAKMLLEFLTTQNIEYYKVVPLQEFKRVDQEEAEFQRMKKMKDDYTKEDLASLTQLIMPAILLLFYCIFCSVFVSNTLDSYEKYLDIWLECSGLLPETSVSLMNVLLGSQQLNNTSLSSKFFQIEERFEYVVITGGLDSANMQKLIQGDPCSTPELYIHLGINLATLCTNSTSLQLTLSNVLNYMSTVLQTQNATTPTNWSSLIAIQFDFVKPLLNNITDSLGETLTALRHQCEQYVIILGIILVCLLLLSGIYIACYPLADIYERILFTTDLIKILPCDRESEPDHALAAMTTEAMETY